MNINNQKALFVISSPFQAICALEAICEFNVHSYCFLIVLTSTNTRLDQIRYILDLRSVSYEIITLKKISYSNIVGTYRSISLKTSTRFEFIFLGDYFSLQHIFLSIISSRKKSKIIFLDDGLSTIVASKRNLYGCVYNIKRKLLLLCLNVKNVNYRTFFTIFKNGLVPKFNILHNNLDRLRSAAPSEQGKKIACIIGTPVEEYCLSYGVEVNQFFSSFRDIVNELNCDDIIFSPHGRCTNVEIIRICEELNIEVKYSKVSVEFDYLQNGICPQIIIAFDSTVFYTLHAIFQQAQFLNIQIIKKGFSNNEFEICEKYFYEDLGIPTKRILID